MRRYTIGLLGFVLAATMAAPVMAGNMAPASSTGGTDSLLPPAGEPPTQDVRWPCTCWVDGSQVVERSGLYHRLPREDSPSERVQ
jgi:hypothetical protein